MRISLDLELKDVPGQLVKALVPISSYGGNIVSVVHMREKSGRGERVPVHVIFEMDNSGRLEEILNALEERDIWVSKVGEVKKKEEITVILIGHIVDTDMRDTIDKINAVRGAMVADLALAMPHPDKETSARMDIDLASSEVGKKVLQCLDEIAIEKDLLVVKSLGV